MKNKLLFILIVPVLLVSCSPEAPWTTKNVEINMTVETVSAGFIECSFSTNKDAYYLIAIERARPYYNPMEHQKQFMMLALDSANLAYLQWRNELLKKGESHIAPFSSHALQYGTMKHFFTSLDANTDYWVYCFVVNPETLKPVGKLNLVPVTTGRYSVDIYFEYRVKGSWDYIYPVDSTGEIYDRYPFLTATEDSAELTDKYDMTAIEYFDTYFATIMKHPDWIDRLSYGVKVQNNDGWDSDVMFEEGHTYYKAIVGWDGVLGNNVIYKFTWTGEDFEAYFKNEDSLVFNGELE